MNHLNNKISYTKIIVNYNLFLRSKTILTIRLITNIIRVNYNNILQTTTNMIYRNYHQYGKGGLFCSTQSAIYPASTTRTLRRSSSKCRTSSTTLLWSRRDRWGRSCGGLTSTPSARSTPRPIRRNIIAGIRRCELL